MFFFIFKGSSGSHDSQTCQSYSAHERSSNNIEVLRNQLLAVSAASAQTSDVATSSQDEDPNNIIDSHVNRVFRDTLDCSPSPSYSPTPLCADCAPGTGSQTHGGSNQATSGVSCCHHHSSSSGGKNCSTLPSRLLHHCQQISSAGASHNNNNSINSSNITSSAKLFSSSMKRGNRLETCSNLSVSSGVDSGCFDVSSQFSTESERYLVILCHINKFSKKITIAKNVLHPSILRQRTKNPFTSKLNKMNSSLPSKRFRPIL